MKNIKYLFEFILIMFFFVIFKIIGLKLSSYIGGLLGNIFGPLIRKKKLIKNNILKALPNIDEKKINLIQKNMWNSYGRILSEYVFLKELKSDNFKKNIIVEGQEVLDKIRDSKKPVIFVSGHFSNYELMTLQIVKTNIPLSAVYRPLNNFFMRMVQDKIRNKYISENYIPKGVAGTRKLLKYFRKGSSIAIMIDQRVSQGEKIKFFNHDAYTTTIPAQFSKKYKCEIVPIYIERLNGTKFKIIINKPMKFKNEDSIKKITTDLNLWLESMILKNPSQWIWTHNRWK
jgi:KDO2-lipid IV(A) lauroyltransferase